MKIGLLAEKKEPFDKRVPLTPEQCARLMDTYAEIEVVVQSSSVRCFSDNMYAVKGVSIVNDLSDCDVLFGVKEVPKEFLIANKTYFYFAHIIKCQPYNRSLLLRMIELNIKMIDYEVLKDQSGKRILGFGEYAGVVGSYNTFLTYGLKSGKYKLKPAYKCHNRVELEAELSKIELVNEKIVITGKGRVGNGVLEIVRKLNIRQVSKLDFINNYFNEPVFVHLDSMDYNVRVDGLSLGKKDFYANPELYSSSFMQYAEKADIFIAGHFYSSGSPYLFTKKDAKASDFKIKVIGDISCDIDGPVPTTIRSSSILDPIYGYNVITCEEDDYRKEKVIAVMAVDNLPCELPIDSSEYFGNELLNKVLPLLIRGDEIINKATICKNGDLTPYFEHLRDYVEGN